MDKFNLDVSLGHSAPRTYRDPHLCFDSDGEEDCRKVRQGENDHQSTGDGVDHEWWCVFDECVDFSSLKREAIDGRPPPGVEPAAQHGKTHQV